MKSIAKRKRFANRMKHLSMMKRVFRENAGKPGFIGVTTRLTITTPDGKVSYYGAGALYAKGIA